ncbi:MAG: toprim domain-containing protein [Atopobiaceae bacterium]|nr:toprim domain-containing protein [Atopobiaceae bacterium]
MTNEFESVRDAVDLDGFCELLGLEKRGHHRYVCPFCDSGNGPRHSAAFTVSGSHWKCYACNRYGDVFDLVGAIDGIDGRREQLTAVAERAGISLEDGRSSPASRHGGVEAKAARKAPSGPTKKTIEDGRMREAEYVTSMRENVEDPVAKGYLLSRGFTQDEIEGFGFGYDPSRRRVIIPWEGSDHYHIDRSVDDSNPKYTKPKSDVVGPQPLYDPSALSSPAFFLVEGALDALAVRACGFKAVALGGTGGRTAVETLSSRKFKGVVIVMLDNDNAGISASEEIGNLLTNAGIPHVFAPHAEHKDAGEWLQKNRDDLRSFLSKSYTTAIETAAEQREEAYKKALSNLRVLNPSDVAASLFDLSDAFMPIPTGFDSLDRALDGGLQVGLYVLGAVSSLGKTTFCVQLADTVAIQGQPCLFVTIEQSAAEITAKSLSRLMSCPERAYSTSDITNVLRRNQWGLEDHQKLTQACNTYSTHIAPNLRILEGYRQPTTGDIRSVAELMGDHYGKPPVIFLDYLQLLAPQNERDTDKQAIDNNVMALRQMARDLRTPIIVISSLNRSSYSEGVTMDSWKESGAIEYGADVLLGLQPAGIREHLDAVKDSRTKREADRFIRQSKAGAVRNCELLILKNRSYRMPESGIPLQFRPCSSSFREGPAEPDEGSELAGRHM